MLQLNFNYLPVQVTICYIGVFLITINNFFVKPSVQSSSAYPQDTCNLSIWKSKSSKKLNIFDINIHSWATCNSTKHNITVKGLQNYSMVTSPPPTPTKQFTNDVGSSILRHDKRAWLGSSINAYGLYWRLVQLAFCMHGGREIFLVESHWHLFWTS